MTIWTELGIEPTKDRAAIRRAYAARLKLARPDADPEGFARLRQAYEAALAGAEQAPQTIAAPPPAVVVPASVPVPPPTVAPAVPAPPAPAATPKPAPAPETPPVRPSAPEPAPATPPPLVESGPKLRPIATPTPAVLILQSIDVGDVSGAVDLLLQARQRLTLTLAADMRLADLLAARLAQDTALSAATVREAATRLGWNGMSSIRSHPAVEALQRRLSAEAWLEALRNDGGRWTRHLGLANPVTARMLLGRGRMRGAGAIWLGTMAGDPNLRRRFGEWLLHAPALGDGLDPERLEQIRRVITGQAAPRTRSVVTQVYNGAALLVPGAGVFAFLNDDHHTLALEAGAATVVVTFALAFVWRRRRAKR